MSRKSNTSKAEAVTTGVKSIETYTKKQIGKINVMRTSEAHSLQAERDRVKKELESLKAEDPNASNWDDQALGIAEHMKSIVQKEIDLNQKLLVKSEEVTQELEMRTRPLRKELPTILDFSEEDRVHLNLQMDKALQEMAKKRADIVENDVRLQKQLAFLIENAPSSSIVKEQIIMKLESAFETITLANDPEVVRSDLLAHMANEKKEVTPPKGPAKKSSDKGPGTPKKS